MAITFRALGTQGRHFKTFVSGDESSGLDPANRWTLSARKAEQTSGQDAVAGFRDQTGRSLHLVAAGGPAE